MNARVSSLVIFETAASGIKPFHNFLIANIAMFSTSNSMLCSKAAMSTSTSPCLLLVYLVSHLALICTAISQIVLSESGSGIITQFEHDACEVETHNNLHKFTYFHDAKPFMNENGLFELLVRFRTKANGHMALTVNRNDSDPLYMILIGSYNNRFSEIRRTTRPVAQVTIDTPEIMSSTQWRGFVIQYNLDTGQIWVYPEGSNTILLFWKDPVPLQIKYFSFKTWNGQSMEVAFDCRAKDIYSTVSKTAAYNPKK